MVGRVRATYFSTCRDRRPGHAEPYRGGYGRGSISSLVGISCHRHTRPAVDATAQPACGSGFYLEKHVGIIYSETGSGVIHDQAAIAAAARAMGCTPAKLSCEIELAPNALAA